MMAIYIQKRERVQVYVNGVFSGGSTNTVKFSLYVSLYLVADQGGRYTKHIYIGSQRIVSKLGDFASYGSDPRRIPYAGSEADAVSVDYKGKYASQQQVIKDNYATFNVPYNGEDNNDYVDGEGFCCNDGTPEAAQARAMARTRSANGNFKPNEDYEKMQFYYHPDHLGSSSYITNLDGEVVQHIEYVPFGEVFIEERNNTWNTPYLFNAKELDEETGLYYYGARYMDPKISMWLGVDPMAEKYPNLTGYCYTMDNPIKFIDPDGKQIKENKPKPSLGGILKRWGEKLKSLWRGDPNYKGSGWGHGVRRKLAELLHNDNKASNIAEAGLLSLLQSDKIVLEGEALNKIKNDPAMVAFDNELIGLAKQDPNYRKRAFSFIADTKVIEFGGKRAPEDMVEQAKDPLNPRYRDTWKVGANELTWLVRHASVRSSVYVSRTGIITITHNLHDQFDLRPTAGRTGAYNIACQVLGTMYHDVLGGNDKITIEARWQIKK